MTDSLHRSNVLTEALEYGRLEVEDLLVEFCCSSSPSHDQEGLRRTAELLASHLAELGLEPRIDGDLVLTARSGNEPRLFVVGHFDTVLAAREPVKRDRRLIATGAVDMKGGIAAFLGALAVLRHLGIAPPDFLLALVPDEEVGGPLSASIVCQHARTAREMWVLEPGQPVGEEETIVLGRWGLATWQLEARGVSAHSGLDFEKGRSALAAAARWVDRAQSLGQLGRTSFNAATFLSPSPLFESRLAPLNVVPDRANVRGELRFADNGAGRELTSELQRLADTVSRETGVHLAFEEDRIPAYSAAGDDDWLMRLKDTASEVGLRIQFERSRRGISFSNFLPPTDRPRVLDGLGPVGGGMHTESEWLCLDSLHRRTALLSRMLLESSRGF